MLDLRHITQAILKPSLRDEPLTAEPGDHTSFNDCWRLYVQSCGEPVNKFEIELRTLHKSLTQLTAAHIDNLDYIKFASRFMIMTLIWMGHELAQSEREIKMRDAYEDTIADKLFEHLRDLHAINQKAFAYITDRKFDSGMDIPTRDALGKFYALAQFIIYDAKPYVSAVQQTQCDGWLEELGKQASFLNLHRKVVATAIPNAGEITAIHQRQQALAGTGVEVFVPAHLRRIPTVAINPHAKRPRGNASPSTKPSAASTIVNIATWKPRDKPATDPAGDPA